MPSQFNASASADDTTAPADLLARWDFENDGIWDLNYPGEAVNPTTTYATNTVTHQYPAAGSYTVAVQVRDSAGQDSDSDPATPGNQPTVITIVIGGGTIALNPDRAPTTYTVDSYNFGVIPPNKTVDILVTICNLGVADLIISGYGLENEAPDMVPPNGFTFRDTTGAADFIAPLTLAEDTALPVVCNPNVNPLSRQDARIRFYAPLGTIDGIYSADLVIVSNDNTTPTGKRLSLSVIVQTSQVGTQGSESVKFDGRTIANPPPLFVEFLDQLQFKEEQKTK